MPTLVLIADDHPAVRQGLRLLLDTDPDFEVVAQAADGTEAVSMALELKPDLIILDNSMPGMTGIEVARVLRANAPDTKIIFHTLDRGIRDLVLAAGAVAHITKDQSPQEILRVIRSVAGLEPGAVEHVAGSQAQLAELLVAEKLLTPRQLADFEGSRDAKQTLSNSLLRSNLVPEDRLASLLARTTDRPFISLAAAVVPAVAKQLPRRFCELRACVLMEMTRTTATLAVADPLDAGTVTEAKDILGGVELQVVTATLSDVREALKRAYAPTVVPLGASTAAQPTQRRSRRPLMRLAAFATAAIVLVASGLGLVVWQGGTPVEARANLTIFEGSVEVRHGLSGAFVAATNELVAQGDAVRVGPSAHAALTFFEGSTVVLQPGTELELATLRPVSDGRDINVVMHQLSGQSWHIVGHKIGEGGHYEVQTATASNTVQGTAFGVSIGADGATTVRATDGVVQTAGLDGATAPAVKVTAGTASVITRTGPTAPAVDEQATLRFAFDAARNGLVVNAAGESAGVRDGQIVRYIPGAVVERVGDTIVVKIPGKDAGRFTTVVEPAADAPQVHMTTSVHSPAGAVVSEVSETRPVDGTVARGGITVAGVTLDVLTDAAAHVSALPLIAAPPPPPVRVNPLALVPQGETGPAGPSGTSGPAGLAGPAGPPGPQGVQGVAGARGLTGPTGADGAAGTAGPTGPAGAAGANGADGAQGPAGFAGAAGVAGATGATGPAGASGAEGPTGPSGGPVGPSGPSGPVGATGSQGPSGATGQTGGTGATGPAGTTGPIGATGAVGAIGATGSVGATGAAGAQGPTGPQGTTGASGVQGIAGPTGATGPIGPSGGPVGPTGATGAQGTTGATGSQGVQGDTGPAGSQGATGTTGAPGPIRVTGSTRATGVAGATRATGSHARTGADGATGSVGATGAVGAIGAQGSTGTTGSTGATGATGSIGATGAQGPTGAQGTTGTTGSTGATGLTGATGAAGATGAQGSTGRQRATCAAGATRSAGATGAAGAARAH